MRKGLVSLLGSATMVFAVGCASHHSQSHRPQTNINTETIRSGKKDFNFDPSQLDLLNAQHDKYAIVPRTAGTDVKVNGLVEGKFEQYDALTIGGRLIPYSNSATDRTPNSTLVTPNGAVSFLANFSYDGDHKLQPNTGKVPLASYFVVEQRQFPETVRNDELNLVESRILESVKRTAGYAQFENLRLLALGDVDTEGRPTRVYVDLATVQPHYREKRTPGQPTVVQFGFDGVGYYPTRGIEVAKPVPAEEPPIQYIPRVLEGGQAVYIAPLKKSDKK